MLALVKTGFAGLDSYGPWRFLERAIVTMWPTPVPPVRCQQRYRAHSRRGKLTFGGEEVIPPILVVDVRSFRGLARWTGSVGNARHSFKAASREGSKTYHSTGSIPDNPPLPHGTRVEVGLGQLDIRPAAVSMALFYHAVQRVQRIKTHPICQACAPVMYVLPSTSQKGSVS